MGIVVFYKIATTCLLILVGYTVKRLRLLPEATLTVLSKYIFYVSLPCYVVYNTVSSVDWPTLAADWRFVVLSFALLMVTDIFGHITAKLWAGPGEHATFRMLVALPNWVFMALAVAEPLFRQDGVRVVLLCNVGITLYIWTLGLTSFKPASGFKRMLRAVFFNLQSASMLLGLVLAVALPFLRGMERLSSAELAAMPVYLGIITPFWETVSLLAQTSLPLSIFQIGLLLAEPAPDSGVRTAGTGALARIAVLRLLAAPAVCLGAMAGLVWLGMALSQSEFVTIIIIMAMPPAVLIVSVVKVYGGAGRLAARSLVWGGVAGLLTAPLLTSAAQAVYAWLH